MGMGYVLLFVFKRFREAEWLGQPTSRDWPPNYHFSLLFKLVFINFGGVLDLFKSLTLPFLKTVQTRKHTQFAENISCNGMDGTGEHYAK